MAGVQAQNAPKRDGDDALSITDSPRRTRRSKRTRKTAADTLDIAAQVKAARDATSDGTKAKGLARAGRSKRDAAQNAAKSG